MDEVRYIKSDRVMDIVQELLDQDQRVRITVTGMSMYPFLRDNMDSVELYSTDFSEIRVGDILLIVTYNQQFVLHRVIKKRMNYIYINGDAQQWWEGPVFSDQIVAKVSKVWRQDRCIPCSLFRWRALSFVWRLLFPFRYLIIRSYKRLRRFVRLVKE